MTIQEDPVTTHPHPLRRLRRALAALAIGSLALASLAACGSDQAAAGADDTVTLRLGDPGNNGVLAYAKKTGILEKELAKVGAKVEWGGQYASFTATIDAGLAYEARSVRSDDHREAVAAMIEKRKPVFGEKK